VVVVGGGGGGGGWWWLYSDPEILSYFATRGRRLASLVFLVCKCLIIQGCSGVRLRAQPKKEEPSVVCGLWFVFWWWLYSDPKNLSYFATRGRRLASLVFLVCKCLIIQGGSGVRLRAQPSVFHIFQLDLLESRSLSLLRGRTYKGTDRFLSRTGYPQAL
jgi:hypothetical protein